MRGDVVIDNHSQRWKRRGRSRSRRRWRDALFALLVFVVTVVAIYLLTRTAPPGPEGPFAEAVYTVFPEADPLTIETRYKGDAPSTATIHLPADLIDAPRGIGDPFERLGKQFGGSGRVLRGPEMARRLEALGDLVMPADMPRCHTYEVGEISTASDSPRQMRRLYLYLNPGCE